MNLYSSSWTASFHGPITSTWQVYFKGRQITKCFQVRFYTRWWESQITPCNIITCLVGFFNPIPTLHTPSNIYVSFQSLSYPHPNCYPFKRIQRSSTIICNFYLSSTEDEKPNTTFHIWFEYSQKHNQAKITPSFITMTVIIIIVVAVFVIIIIIFVVVIAASSSCRYFRFRFGVKHCKFVCITCIDRNFHDV